MALFQRLTMPFIEDLPAREVPPSLGPRSTGEVLRQRREEFGLSLEEAAAALRIKAVYLSALEEGRADGLPGPAYAVGFTRSYSSFLGLDSGEVLRRLKSEKAELGRKPDLAFPIPLGERSLPSGSVLLVALILALCGYGAWHYFAHRTRLAAEHVGPVPASFLQKPKATAEPAKKKALNGVAAATPATPATPAAPAANAPSEPSAGGSALLSPSPKSESAAASPPAAEAAKTAVASTPAMSANASTPATSTSGSAASASASAATPLGNPPAGAPSAGQPPAALAANTVAAPPPEPVSEAGTSTSQIVIRATSDSWIEVQAADGSVLFERILKPGESYRVPNGPGMTLRTGNAGGLSITVDGKRAPSLGAMGRVLHHIALDPQALLAGKAIGG